MTTAEQHRRERLRYLDRRCRLLEAERVRLERLLALTCGMAAVTLKCDPMLVLDTIIEIDGTNPARTEAEL